MKKYLYFDSDEFQKCTPSCSIDDMDPAFLVRLDTARSIAGIPFVINSAFRPLSYELSVGRKGTSSHCKGVAVDIRCTSTAHRFRIVFALLKAGFSRIGISSRFIHVDSDSSKPDSIWLY